MNRYLVFAHNDTPVGGAGDLVAPAYSYEEACTIGDLLLKYEADEYKYYHVFDLETFETIGGSV